MVFKGKTLGKSDIIVFLGRCGTIIILFAMILCFSIFLPAFRSGINILNLLGQFSVLSIFAIGMTCPMKMGDFDLSIGAISAITGLVVGTLLVNGYSVTIAIIAGLLTGMLVGAFNGILVAYVGLPALVTTLGTMNVILGLAMAVTQGGSIWDIPKTFAFIGRNESWGIPNRFFIMIVLLFSIWFIHKYTPTGRRMEAIGGNLEAARLSGINVEWHRTVGYILCGLCAAIAGMVLVSTVMSANPTLGTYYLLDAFGAVFIGAATIRVGQFHIWGTFVGVTIWVIAINGLTILMVPSYLTNMIRGSILLLAIFLSGAVSKYYRS